MDIFVVVSPASQWPPQQHFFFKGFPEKMNKISSETYILYVLLKTHKSHLPLVSQSFLLRAPNHILLLREGYTSTFQPWSLWAISVQSAKVPHQQTAQFVVRTFLKLLGLCDLKNNVFSYLFLLDFQILINSVICCEDFSFDTLTTENRELTKIGWPFSFVTLDIFAGCFTPFKQCG